MRVIFMGTPEFSIPSLEKLVASEYQVVSVYTQPDRPAGRGRRLVSPPVKLAAQSLGLEVRQPASLKDDEVLKQISELRPDIIVVVGFGQLLPQAVLKIPPFGCVNVHPSLLPRFRGASPVASAILAGDEFSGVSIMLMDEGMDTGPLLARAQIPISANDTTGSLSAKLSLVGASLLLEALTHYLKGRLTPQPQNNALATYSHPIRKQDGEINWHLPATELWRRVRAFNPWPGCYTWWRGKKLDIIEALPLGGEKRFRVGEVVGLGEKGFGVATGDGVLLVSRVQLEGKKPMSAAEFLRGQREFIGSVLPSS